MPDLIKAFDVDSYNKGGFDFRLAKQAGYDTGYIKLGGDNLSPRYRGTGYPAQFERMVNAGITNRGSYWVTGGYDPVASARFYLANRDPRTTFDVLDNEVLDDGRAWSDAEACAFFDVLLAAGLTNLMQYGSRDALWNAGQWPGLQRRGIKAIVALYNGSPWQNITPRTYPAELVVGHQFTSSARIGGLSAVDENVFVAHAFSTTTTAVLSAKTLEEEFDMSAIHLNGVKDTGIILRGSDAPYSMEEQIFQATAGGLGLHVVELEKWQYDTVVREQWTAWRTAQAMLGQPGGSVDQVRQIADSLRQQLPAPDPA